MAAGVLPKPGTKYGPCELPCGHTDCRETMAMARRPCYICKKPIGYEVRFYSDIKGFVHANCLEEEIDERN